MSNDQQKFDRLMAEHKNLRHGIVPEAALGLIENQQKMIKELVRQRDELKAARLAYASEFPRDVNGELDTGNIHRNIRDLKADRDYWKRLALDTDR